MADLKCTPEIMQEILDGIAEGKTLAAICRSDPDRFPEARTARRHFMADPEWLRQYAAARQFQGHSLFDEIVDAAEAAAEDGATQNKQRGLDIKIKALEWAAAKLVPREYSDRSQPVAAVAIQINTNLGSAEPIEGVAGNQVYTLTAHPQELAADQLRAEARAAGLPPDEVEIGKKVGLPVKRGGHKRTGKKQKVRK